jgi:uncharacterized damage-inducible protein DinB
MHDPALRQLRLLTRYNAWANARLYEALATLTPGELAAPRNPGASSMLSVLGHAWVVDRIWQAHLEGRAHGHSSRQAEGDLVLSSLRQAQAQLDGWYVACADGLDAARLEEVVHFRFVDGGTGAMRRGDIVLHVVNHKTYHRGYVADMLYQAGRRPPVMDLPVFLRDVPQPV